jgi:signal transduction histidine kinase/ActR/RegA family two-component response regulator/HAMP domain-containing protein
MSAIDPLRRYVGGSIARQIVLGVVAVQAVLTIALCGVLIYRTGETQIHTRVQRAQGVADMVAASSASRVISNDRAGLEELINAADRYRGLRYVIILSTDGRILAHTQTELIGQKVTDTQGRSLLTGPAQPRTLAVTDRSIDVASPILAQGRLVGWTWVSLTRTDLKDALRQQILNAGLYTAGAALVAALVAFVLARRLASGLQVLTQVTNRFREGDRQVRVTRRRFDELGAVGDGVNAMLDAITETERSLRTTQKFAKIGSWRYLTDSPNLIWSPEVYEVFGMDPLGPAPARGVIMAGLSQESRAAVIAVMTARPLPETFGIHLRYQPPGGGNEIVVWMEGRSELDDQGRLVGLAGVCQDITEREAAAAQLQQAQKMESVGQLTGGLAHDFNNLLAIIIGNLDMISEDLPAGSESKEFAETAMQAALKGSELTRQLLAFSRRQPLDPKVIDLNGLVTEMDTLWRRTLGQDITINLGLAPDLWRAKVDRSQMESALLNLVINARDAMAAGGALTVETMNTVLDNADPDLRPGEYAVIAVSDTGHGMSAEVLLKASEPFFTTKAVGQGSGLGLSMVYGFAKQSGGQMKIYSEVDLGTTVRIYLPRADHATLEEAPTSSTASVAGKGERVLVVEDNREVRRVAVRQLTELGYGVVEAEDARSGLQILHDDDAIDLVFTDIVMPGGMDGIEMIEQARQTNPTLRALFTTGFTRAAVANNNRATGSDLLITKPYRRAELAAKLREALTI